MRIGGDPRRRVPVVADTQSSAIIVHDYVQDGQGARLPDRDAQRGSMPHGGPEGDGLRGRIEGWRWGPAG